MTKFLTAALISLSFTASTAQQVKINWGEESKTELVFNSFVNGQGTDMIKLCFESHGGGLFSGARKITPILVRYSDKLSELNVRKYEVDEDNMQFNTLLSVKGKLYMFTNRYDKESKSTTFYCQALDITTLNPVGKVITLGSFDAINKSSQSTVGYELSQDSSKILLFGLSPYSKKDNEKYYMAVYDNDMKKIWENTVELPYRDKYVTVFDKLVTNEGKVAIVIKHYDQEVSRESISQDGERVPSYKTKFIVFDDSKSKPVEYILNINNKYVHTLQVTDDNANNLVLFGLYKERYNGYVSGFFVTTIDKTTKEATTKKMAAFPEELVEQVKKDKQGSDKERDPGFGPQFRLVDIVDRNDKSKDYLIEYSSEVYHPASSYYNGRTTVYTPAYWVYRYGDIIDICTKANGSTVMTRIPKLQASTNIRMYSNFKALPYKDKLLLFYNDDKDNIDRDITKKPDDVDKFHKSVFTMSVIDSKGALTRSVILDHRDMKLVTAVRECRKIDDHRIGLYAQRTGGLFTSAKDMVGILEVK